MFLHDSTKKEHNKSGNILGLRMESKLKNLGEEENPGPKGWSSSEIININEKI